MKTFSTPSTLNETVAPMIARAREVLINGGLLMLGRGCRVAAGLKFISAGTSR
jgi:hypothetical protein